MATMNISLPDSLRSYVEERISKDGYSTASEYFRELVRRDQERKVEEKLEALLLKGLDSKGSKPLTKADLEEVRKAVHARLAETKKPKA